MTQPNGYPYSVPYELTDAQRAAFQKLFRTARSLMGMTQYQVAQGAGVTQPTIHALENGPHKKTTLIDTLRVAKFLGIPPNVIATVLGLYEEPEGQEDESTYHVFLTKLKKITESQQQSLMAVLDHYVEATKNK